MALNTECFCEFGRYRLARDEQLFLRDEYPSG
jgi:hypothetical protein